MENFLADMIVASIICIVVVMIGEAIQEAYEKPDHSNKFTLIIIRGVILAVLLLVALEVWG